MGVRTKIITGREIYEAIEKNGFEIMREDWIEGEGKNISACILGMAAINLGVAITDEVTRNDINDDNESFTLVKQLNKYSVSVDNPWYIRYNNMVGEAIYNHFDSKDEIDTLIEDILDRNDWDSPEYVEAYNKEEQKLRSSVEPTRLSQRDDNILYKLSWKESVAMAKDILTPVFDEKFEVLVEDYAEMLNWTPPQI